TTMSVSQAASRVGMSESDLRAVNNIPPRMQVRAGSSLLVPRTDQRNADVPGHVADNARLSLQPDVVLTRTTVRARKGENLARLARRYGVSAVSVADWNKLAVNAPLTAGQRITLLLPKRAAVASGARKPAARAASTSKRKASTAAARKPVKARAASTSSKSSVATTRKK
ncbi:MAG: LysM peptidoglycan-binding domain-containing protein, partial [Lysobacteraceae bacterium]